MNFLRKKFNIHSVFYIVILLTSTASYSQELREQAIKNIGSSVAYLALCEREKLMTEMYASKIILSTQKNLVKILTMGLGTNIKNPYMSKSNIQYLLTNGYR